MKRVHIRNNVSIYHSQLEHISVMKFYSLSENRIYENYYWQENVSGVLHSRSHPHLSLCYIISLPSLYWIFFHSHPPYCPNKLSFRRKSLKDIYLPSNYGTLKYHLFLFSKLFICMGQQYSYINIMVVSKGE